MRNQWRSLLLRSASRSSFQNPTTNLLQVQKVDRNFSYLSSFLDRNVHGNAFAFGSDFRNPTFRSFSSESALEPNKKLDHTVLTDVLSKSSSNEEIKTGFKSIDLSISHEMVFSVFKSLQENPDVAMKFLNFISETQNDRLCSISYNLMLGILGRKDYEEQFLSFMEKMKKKGFRVSKETYLSLSENLQKQEMGDALDKLKELYGMQPVGSSIEKVCSRICKVIRNNEWDEDAQQKLRDMNVSWSNDLVVRAVEHLSPHPKKALEFFSWVEENPSFKHNKLSYTAMLKVLARESCIEKFWRIVDEMKKAGYQMDMEMFILLKGQFYKKSMNKDAVDLYEFMMGSATKPSVDGFVSLMRKIAASKDLDMDLFSRVLKIYTDGGNKLKKSTLDLVTNTLSNSGRLQECGKILKAMEKGGFVPTDEVYNKTIFQLCSVGRSEEAIQIFDEMQASGYNPDSNTWRSLIHGQCVAGELEKASSSFRSMVEKVGVTGAGYAFESLIKGFCQNRRAEDAYKFLSETVDGTDLRPLHTTYRTLIQKLLVGGRFDEALSLLRLMKDNDHPPFLDPFIAHISKSGSGTDAMRFLTAVTDGSSQSTPVFIRMFEAFFKAGRHIEAQNLFSECPSYICAHADVLNIFHDQKPEDADATSMAV